MKWNCLLLAFLLIVSTTDAHAAKQLDSQSNPAAPVSTRIYDTAKSSIGQEMWHGYGLNRGTYGCSAALSNILKRAGVTGANTALVTTARRQLFASPAGCSERTVRSGEGKEIDDAILLRDCKPGDILLAFKTPPTRVNGGADAHCGIMGQGTHVYSNNWNDGIWTEVEIHQMFDYYPYIRLLRLGGRFTK